MPMGWSARASFTAFVARRVTPLLVLACLLAPAAVAQGPPSALPEQPHVTLAEEGLVIHFAVAGVPYLAGQVPQVLYAIDGGGEDAMPAAVAGTVAAVAQTDVFATTVYAATLPVAPGQSVTYRAGDAVRGYVGPFTVTRPGDGPLRFVVLADIGYEDVAADGTGPATAAPIAMRDLAAEQDADLLLIAGDLSYANTRAGWDRYMRMHSPLQATVPTMPTIGNHEWEDAEGYGLYLAEYVLPGNEMDFTFQSGPVTFIAVNSDGACTGSAGRGGSSLLSPCPDGPDMTRLEWLRSALEAAEADATPWTVVFMHHPPYSWGRHGNDWATQIYWSPLFDEHGVDLVVTAHDHLYSRSYPVKGREPVATGNEYAKGTAPVYVVLGGGGRPLYTASDEEPPAWFAKGESVHHLGLFDVDEQHIAYRAVRIDGSTLDEFTITATGAAGTGGSEAASALAMGALVAALLVGALQRRR